MTNNSNIVNIIKSATTENRPVRIATHDGVFHADEVFAVAAIADACKYMGATYQLYRTRNESVLSACDIRVDVGGKFHPETGDFDHHHDITLPASCTLVWDDLCGSVFVRQTLLDPISSLDCNFSEYTKKYPIGPYKTVGQAIMDFYDSNHPNGSFDEAVKFARLVLRNSVRKAEEREAHLKTIADGKNIGEFAASYDAAIPYNEFRAKLDRPIIVFPDPVSGHCVVSLDTDKFNFANIDTTLWPELLFTHKAGFFTKWQTKEAAVEFAEAKSEWRSQEIDQWAIEHNEGRGARQQ